MKQSANSQCARGSPRSAQRQLAGILVRAGRNATPRHAPASIARINGRIVDREGERWLDFNDGIPERIVVKPAIFIERFTNPNLIKSGQPGILGIGERPTRRS